MDALYLIARIADRRVAFAADRVESVVELAEVVPVPRVAAHVAGLSALRSRVITVIDSRAVLGLRAAIADEGQQAIVTVIDGHSYGITADSVDDVIIATGGVQPPGGAIDPVWREAMAGIVEIEGDLVPLIDLDALVAGPVRIAA